MKMQRNIFWSLFGPQLVILLACILGLAFYAWRSNRQAISREWLRVMETQSTLATSLVVDDAGLVKSPVKLQALCDQLLKETGLRVTILNPAGKVLADSEARSETMLLHADRPEIIEALRDGYGHSGRYSTTLRRKMHYVARRIDDASGAPTAVVRVAIERQALDAPVRRSMRFFAALLALIVVASVGLSYYFARRVTMPVAEMRAGLRRLGEGDLGHRLRLPGTPHLAALAREINETGARLGRQVHQIEADRALREGILAGMREGIIALDGQRRVVMMNTAARRLLGIGERNVEGQPLDLVVHSAELLSLVDSAMAADGPLEAEIHLRDNNGSQLWAGTNRWRSEDGSHDGTLVILNDLTQVRRLEQIRRDFVSNVSHELRTPVTSIKGFTETLLDEPPPDAATGRRFLTIIHRQSEQLQMILNDMLLLARLEDAGTELTLATVDAQTLIDQACEVCEARALARNVTLQKVVPNPFNFQGHAHLLEQALVNLIDNAIKYGGENKRVSVQAILRNQTITLTVQDQGPGIDPAQTARIFERFYRIDTGRSRDQGGCGLGLAVVKHVIRVHHGTATVENLPEGGCAFRLALPLAMLSATPAGGKG
jgi:two-component system phosphate regulon sensor histidine kinase PhoR